MQLASGAMKSTDVLASKTVAFLLYYIIYVQHHPFLSLKFVNLFLFYFMGGGGGGGVGVGGGGWGRNYTLTEVSSFVPNSCFCQCDLLSCLCLRDSRRFTKHICYLV